MHKELGKTIGPFVKRAGEEYGRRASKYLAQLRTESAALAKKYAGVKNLAGGVQSLSNTNQKKRR